MFGRLLGPRSFISPKRPLAYEQPSPPIIFNGVMLISTSTITPTTYLRNWALVVLVIATRFIVDQYHFLLEALTGIDNNTFPFQQHLKMACVLLPPKPMHVFFHLNNSSNNKWFNFKISSWNICTVIPFPTCFLTKHLKLIMPEVCSSLGAGTWFIIRLIFPFFLHNTSYTT